jgi:hypothetical protein
MNGAEVYASRMLLLLAPVSASALSRWWIIYCRMVSFTHGYLDGLKFLAKKDLRIRE